MAVRSFGLGYSRFCYSTGSRIRLRSGAELGIGMCTMLQSTRNALGGNPDTDRRFGRFPAGADNVSCGVVDRRSLAA